MGRDPEWMQRNKATERAGVMCALLGDSKGSLVRPKSQEVTSRLMNEKYVNLVWKSIWKFLGTDCYLSK